MSAQEKQSPARPYTQLPNAGPLFPRPLRREDLVDTRGRPLFPTQTPYGQKTKDKDKQ